MAAPAAHHGAAHGLTRKIGPLPLWGWLLVGVAGIAAGLYIRNKMSASSSTQTAAPSAATIPDTTGLTGTGSGGGTSSGSGDAISPNTPRVWPGNAVFSGGGGAALDTALSGLASSLAQIGASGSQAGNTTNNYYTTTPTTQTSTPQSTMTKQAEPLTIAQQAANAAAAQGGNKAYDLAVDTASLKGNVVTAGANGLATPVNAAAKSVAASKPVPIKPTPVQKAKQSAGGHGAV